MSYRFQPDESVQEEILRVVDERIQHAIRCLADYPSANPEGIHAARKDIKKVRSLLRLLRGKAHRKLRRSLNLQLRGIGLDLSVRRDQEVLSAMLADWQTRSAVRRKTSLRNAVDRMLGNIQKSPSIAAPLEATIEASVIRRFARVQDTLNKAELQTLRWKSLITPARKRRKRLKQARKAYIADPTSESLHEWRKQLKNRMYQLRLLRTRAGTSGPELKRVKTLEALLGMARDHDLLIERLLESTDTGLSVYELGALLTYAETQKEKLLRKALRKSV